MSAASDAGAPAPSAPGTIDSSPKSSSWLWSPTLDLLFGAGLLYLVLFLVFAAVGPQIRSVQPHFFLPLLVLLVSMPHYGGTLLRVYESRSERKAYAFFTVWTSALIFALFVWGVHSFLIGSLLVTVYLTWSPWHYTGQNYGIAVMFLRRRGVELDDLTKRWLHVSFVLSYVLVFLVFHGSGGHTGVVPFDRFDYDQSSITFLPLGLPGAIAYPTAVVCAIGYVVSTSVALARLLQRSSLSTLGPTLLLVLSQSIWFTLPFTLRYFGATTGIEPLDSQYAIRDYVLWVALAHASQYLWVTSYYAKAAPGWQDASTYWGKVLMCGVAIWTLPAIVFAPDRLGALAYDGGLALVMGAAINIHHFALDGAIWKLRSSRLRSILIRSEKAGESDLVPAPAPGRGWVRPAVWTLCAGATAAAFVGFVWMDVQLQPALNSHRIEQARLILDQAGWVGRDSPKHRRTLAREYFGKGEIELARANYERSLELRPDPDVWGELGYLNRQQGDYVQAKAAYEHGLELRPDHPVLQMFMADLLIETGETPAALSILEQLQKVSPENPQLLQLIERAKAATRS